MKTKAEETKRESKETTGTQTTSDHAVLQWINRVVPLRRLGWGFLLAWVFCIFYAGVVDGYLGRIARSASDDLLSQLFFGGMPVFMSIVMLVLVVGLEKRFGSPTEHTMLFWLAPVLTAASTLMLFWPFGEGTLTTVMFVLGAAFTGVGSGLMWVMWGEYYARIPQDLVEFLAPISAIMAALLVLLLTAVNGWIELVLVISFPLLSGLCFFLSWRDVCQGVGSDAVRVPGQKAFDAVDVQTKSSPIHVLRDMGRTSIGILVACLFVCILGSFWNESDTSSFEFQLIFILSIVFTALVAFASIGGPRRISVSFLYRWMCPALVLGFVAIIVSGVELGGYIANTISIAARFAFCLITQMYFARYATQGKATPVQAFGLGWIFVHLGDFLGVLSYLVIDTFVNAGMISITQEAAGAIGVLVVITMFVLNDEKSFALERSDEPDRGNYQAVVSESSEGAEFKSRVEAIAAQYELTPRETEVLDLLARGRSVPYVRDALFISKETAATHVKHIYAKTGVHSRQELLDLFGAEAESERLAERVGQ